MRAREPGKPPPPRHDPLGERISFARWFPSQALLDWARESGLDDRRLDEALRDVGAKMRGPGDLGWWDAKVVSFVESAIKRHGAPIDLEGQARARELQAQKQAKIDRLRAEARAELEHRGEAPGAVVGDVGALVHGIGE